ncbi:MAG: putative toxin-antitoxin system toxin component, PIN family [Bryobacterales bacterium]|nr:putative toxin-antitoxin system toxin component, PIN family [Bryobacterales bacterium]
MRITLDSTILVRAFDASSESARPLLQIVLAESHELVLSNEILAETSRVLRYPRLRKRHGMSDAAIYEYTMLLSSAATMVRLDPVLVVPIRDANDIVVMQTALVGGADVLCTTDQDFYEPPAREFLHAAGIDVCTDAELHRTLRTGFYRPS